jgi:hypothetical protein
MASPFLFVDKKKVLIICVAVFLTLLLAMSIALGITFSADYYADRLLAKGYNLSIVGGKVYEIYRFYGDEQVNVRSADYYWSIVAVTDDWSNVAGSNLGQRVVVTKYKTIALAKKAIKTDLKNGYKYYKLIGTILIHGTEQGVIDATEN